MLFGTRYSDLCYGYNAFWRHCLAHMQVTCDGFEVETLINIRVRGPACASPRCASVEHERMFGESKLHAVRDGFRVLRTIVTERFRRADGRPRSASRRVSRALGRSGGRIAAGGVAGVDLGGFDLAETDDWRAADQRILAERANVDARPGSDSPVSGRAGGGQD